MLIQNTPCDLAHKEPFLHQVYECLTCPIIIIFNFMNLNSALTFFFCILNVPLVSPFWWISYGRPSVKFKNSLKAPNTIYELVFRVVGYTFLISLFFGRGGGWGKVLRGDGGLKWMLYKIDSVNKLINTLNRPDTVYLDNILECTNGTSSTYVFPLPGNCTLLWVNISFPGLSHFHSIIAISWASCGG